MPERLDDFLAQRPPTADRPLSRQTVLLVEDSRLASEGMRLMCLRSGARVRRADTLAAAARHLSKYRPTVVIVDMGLPDGSGADLIARLSAETPRIPIILGYSGDDGMEDRTQEAGADGFLAKPLKDLATFQEAIISRLPVEERPPGPRAVPRTPVAADPMSLRDDLRRVADMLGGKGASPGIGYMAQFLQTVGRTAEDRALTEAARDLARSYRRGNGTEGPLQRVSSVVADRLRDSPAV